MALVYAVNCDSSKFPEICAHLQQLGATVAAVPLAEANATEFSLATAVVISGGPHLFTAPEGEQLLARFAFIDRLSVPLLGICLGHQAIGLRHGAEVFLGPERRDVDQLQPLVSHPLLDGIPAGTSVREDHCEGITQPPGFTVIASSDSYQNEVMAAAHRPWFGVQFHPEVSADPGRRVFANFLRLAREHSQV